MAAQFPSIQSFFNTAKPSVSASKQTNQQKCSSSGDGFTEQEVDAVIHPSVDENWLPPQEYADEDVASLYAGPRCVMFKGRVANFYHMETPSKRPAAAKGCIKIIVKDETGAITVRLWYAKIDYALRLGQLVTIWTPHISDGEHGILASNQAPLFTSIFPERDRSCHFLIHLNSDVGSQCKTPLGYREGRPLAGLMTLKNFVEGGYEVVEAKILVCVKSIGAKRKVTPKSGKLPPPTCVNVQIFDSTCSAATLSLWGAMADSASAWKPSSTVLLLTRPGYRVDRTMYISITSNTLVDVDPCIPDTLWLRSFAARLTRREDVNPAFPSPRDLNITIAENAPMHIFFTLADLDDFARAAPLEKFTGWINVMITEVKLSLLQRRNMLMCDTHCGVPLYANSPTAICKQCDASVGLRVNPKVLGSVIDETGCSQAGKLYLSEQAWEQLLGRTKGELCDTDVETLRYIEERMLFVRVHLGVAWWAEEPDVGVGRLWVWSVRA